MAGASRRGDIQGLRAVAVVLVVIYHSGIGLPGGYIGVDVFFVISGYVITRMLTAELASSGKLDLKRFYLRRIRRLLPALGLMLSVVMVASVLLGSIGGQQVTARTGAAAALFNANTYLARFGQGGYFDVSADVNALLHTWSLAVEEQFYLVFPALVFAAWLVGRRMPRLGSARATTVTLAVITVSSFVLSWAFTNDYVSVFQVDAIDDLAKEIAFYSAPTRAWQFAVGGLLVFVAPRLVSLGTAVTTVLAAGGAGLVLFAAVAFDQQTPFPGTAALIPTVGTLLILAAGEGPGDNPLSRALAVRPAQYLGDLSYSWYLWHWPCIVFAAALWPTAGYSGSWAAVFSLLPAWLAYRLVESPVRFTPQPRAVRTLALAAVCITLPLVSAGVLEIGHRRIQQSGTIAAFNDSFPFHADVANGCDNPTPLGERDGFECTWAVDNPTGKAVLIGDSNAGHFTEAFTAAANQLGLTATVATKSACPFIDLAVVRNGEPDDVCRQFVAGSLQSLIDSQPNLVVIASANGYVESDAYVLESPNGDQRFEGADNKATTWELGLQRTITQLQSAEIDVVLVHTVPYFPEWDPRECAPARILLAPNSCGASRSLTEADTDRARVISAESAAAATTNIRTLDVADQLCPGGTCSTRLGDTWMYRDGGHISIDASIQLTPIFVELLRPES